MINDRNEPDGHSLQFILMTDTGDVIDATGDDKDERHDHRESPPNHLPVGSVVPFLNKSVCHSEDHPGEGSAISARICLHMRRKVHASICVFILVRMHVLTYMQSCRMTRIRFILLLFA